MTRILVICSSWPHGQSFGGQLRALHITRALRAIGKLTIIVVSSDADDQDARSKTSGEFRLLDPILPRVFPNRSALQKLRWAFDSRYMNLHGCLASEPDRRRLGRSLKDFDLIWVMNSRTPNILHRWQWPRSHLDFDDVPSTYYRSIAGNSSKLMERWRAKALQRLLHRRELLFGQRFTTLSVCSGADKRYLGNYDNIHVIPNGFPRLTSSPLRMLRPNFPRIGFIGLYSYPPNIDGVGWFLKCCWETVRRAVPGVRLRLVGKGTDGVRRPTEPDVDGLGWVDDPTAEIASWSLMIIPIRFGAGTRIKLAEAFSRQCPVVSTRLGAFGYDLSNGRQLLLADTPEDFSRRCIELLQDPAQGVEIAHRAWTEFLEKWTWESISPRVWKAAQDCLSRSGPKSEQSERGCAA